MEGKDRIAPWVDFLTGLKSLTMIRIGELRWHFPSGLFYEDYETCRRSCKGSPLLSLGGIDFVKIASRPIWAIQSFTEMEILDFVGDSPLADIRSRWTMGPEAFGREPVVDDLPTQVHVGPQKQCVRRARWRWYTTSGADVWYTI